MFAETIATVTARDPVEIPVPDAVLDVFEASERVLLVGHVGPDGDCVGAALSLARGLAATGQHADVCVDDVISGFLRRIDDLDQLRSAAALAGGHWDTAVLVDVADPERIGDARHLLRDVATLVVIDHHRVEASRAGFPIAPGADFLAWIDPAFPAASLMAAAILARLRGRIAEVDGFELYGPALAGFATDTGLGRFGTVGEVELGYFKHMLVAAGLPLEQLIERLRFRVPQSVWDLTVNGGLPSESGLEGPEADDLRALERRGLLVEERLIDGAAVVTVPRELLDALVALGRREQPALNDRDVLYALKRERMNRLRDEGAAMTVLLTQGESGRVWVSVRSRDGAARALAEYLGGGGHDSAAGASLRGVTLAAAEERVVTWIRARADRRR